MFDLANRLAALVVLWAHSQLLWQVTQLAVDPRSLFERRPRRGGAAASLMVQMALYWISRRFGACASSRLMKAYPPPSLNRVRLPSNVRHSPAYQINHVTTVELGASHLTDLTLLLVRSILSQLAPKCVKRPFRQVAVISIRLQRQFCGRSLPIGRNLPTTRARDDMRLIMLEKELLISHLKALQKQLNIRQQRLLSRHGSVTLHRRCNPFKQSSVRETCHNYSYLLNVNINVKRPTRKAMLKSLDTQRQSHLDLSSE